MKTTLAFYCGRGDYRDAAIRMATGSRYSHVELVHPDGESISASKRDGNEVRQTRIAFKTGHWAFVSIPVCPERAWARAVEHLGAPYDTLGALFFGGLGIPLHMTAGWYCNELVADAIELPRPWPPHPGALYDRLTSWSRL